MPAGSSPKREREYVKLKTGFEREGRYPGREAEVASRIVNRQRAERGETKAAAPGAAAKAKAAPAGRRAAPAAPRSRPSPKPAARRASPR
jgi:hypothetical protein